MDIETTIKNLQSTYPDLYIPNDPKKALEYLAAGFASVKSDFEEQHRKPNFTQGSAAKVLLPKKI